MNYSCFYTLISGLLLSMFTGSLYGDDTSDILGPTILGTAVGGIAGGGKGAGIGAAAGLGTGLLINSAKKRNNDNDGYSRRSNRNKKKYIDQLEDQLDTCENERDELEDRLSTCRNKLKRSQSENETLTKKNRILKNKIQDLEETIETLTHATEIDN